MNCYIASKMKVADLRLHRIIRAGHLHDCSISDCFLIFGHVTWMLGIGSKFIILDCYSPFIIKPTDLKLYKMIKKNDISITAYWFFRSLVTWLRNTIGGPKFEIIYLFHYWTSGFQTSENYTELTYVSQNYTELSCVLQNSTDLTYVARLYDVRFPDFQSCDPEMK